MSVRPSSPKHLETLLHQEPEVIAISGTVKIIESVKLDTQGKLNSFIEIVTSSGLERIDTKSFGAGPTEKNQEIIVISNNETVNGFEPIVIIAPKRKWIMLAPTRKDYRVIAIPFPSALVFIVLSYILNSEILFLTGLVILFGAISILSAFASPEMTRIEYPNEIQWEKICNILDGYFNIRPLL